MKDSVELLKQKTEEALELADRLGEEICAIHLSTALDALDRGKKLAPLFPKL